MIHFDEKSLLEGYQGGIDLLPQVERIVDEVCERGYDRVVYMGIGGTLASSLQAVYHARELSDLPMYSESAAEYTTCGNQHITSRTVVVISSVSGTTAEMVAAVEKLAGVGVTIIGFIDEPKSPLAQASTYCVSYPENEQLKFFMVADRFMYNAGQFSQYEEFYAQMKEHYAPNLVAIQKQADEWARAYAERHHNDPIHYFVAAGRQWGSTYSYAMCYWEEQHWIRTKSIHAAEFFHGTLEVIDRDTNVTVFLGEGAERPLAERVAKFLPRICAHVELIDSRDYDLPGISPQYRGYLSHLVTHMVTERIDRHMEAINCHPMDIRRYYRCLDY